MVNIAAAQTIVAGASWRLPGLLQRRATEMLLKKLARAEKKLNGNGTANGTTTATEPNGVSLDQQDLAEKNQQQQRLGKRIKTRQQQNDNVQENGLRNEQQKQDISMRLNYRTFLNGLDKKNSRPIFPFNF